MHLTSLVTFFNVNIFHKTRWFFANWLCKNLRPLHGMSMDVCLYIQSICLSRSLFFNALIPLTYFSLVKCGWCLQVSIAHYMWKTVSFLYWLVTGQSHWVINMWNVWNAEWSCLAYLILWPASGWTFHIDYSLEEPQA